MVNLLCNFRKISYDKRTKSAMVIQVKHEGLTELGAEGAIPPHILTGIEEKYIPSNDLLILLTHTLSLPNFKTFHRLCM